MSLRAWSAVAAAAVPMLALGGEFAFDATEFEKKAFEIGGYVEAKHEGFRLNRDAALYRLDAGSFAGRDTLDRVTATVKLNAKARAGAWTFTARSHTESKQDALAHDADGRFDELFASWKVGDGLTVDVGKTALKWGKGYAWNPVGFVERVKDPNDTELAREGYTVVAADIVRNFDGALKTVALTPVIVPVTDTLNDDYGARGRVNVAAKLYLLYGDTDIDVVYLSDGSRSTRYGVDFSRNLGSNLEVHGEWARVPTQEFVSVTPAGVVTRRTDAATSWVVGMRYLTQRDTTWIVELYRNGAGVTAAELRDFTAFARTAAAAGPTSPLFARAGELARTAYGRQSPLRDYLYLRASQKEPFDILYFTPSLTVMVSLEDRSYSVTPELLYSGRGNWEVRARLTALNGASGTDFGEKQNSRRLELLVRYFF